MSRLTVGAWCTRPSRSDVDFAASLRMRRLDVMVNDLSDERSPIRFRFDKLSRDIVEYANSRGIEVHVTSWIMPHVAFAVEAADELQQLCVDTGAHGIVLDAEEPWTKARSPERERAAESFFAAAMGCRVGVTGIGFADVAKLKPLVYRADYAVPQTYVTLTSGLSIAGIPRALAHWRKMECPVIVPALAAYRTTASQMENAFAAVRPAQTVLYWALRHIKSSHTYQRVIRDLTL